MSRRKWSLSCERVHVRRDDNRATIFTSSRKEKADAVQELQAELSCQASERDSLYKRSKRTNSRSGKAQGVVSVGVLRRRARGSR